MTKVENYVFQNCSNLTSVVIPEGVTTVGWYAFNGCSSLTSITLPESVTSVEWAAFSGCSSLASIVLPKRIYAIGPEAFANCPQLLDVYSYIEVAPTVDTNAFFGLNFEQATLHVLASALESYQATAPWSSFGKLEIIKIPTQGQCATPVVGYANGKVILTCTTEDAEVITTIEKGDDEIYKALEIDLVPTYTITAYATKGDYENSDTVTLTLCWIPCTEEHESDETGILTIPSKPILLQCTDGIITLSGLAESTEVAVYTTAGTEVATATATNGIATIATNLEAGATAIVKIGEHSVKVVIK